jgi:DNA polymerase-3 subunit gamma/tau
MANHLASIAEKEGVTFEVDGLHVIAQKADGGLRDALSMFDQIVSFSNKNLTYQAVINNLNILDYDYYFQLMDSISRQDAATTLLIFDKVLNNGFDGGHFIAGLSSHIRNLLVSKEPSTLKLLEVSENIKKRYLEQSQALSNGLLLSALNIANQCEINYRTSKNQRLQVELTLLKMCHIASAIQLGAEGLPALAELKKKLPDSGITAKPVTTTQQATQVNNSASPASPIGKTNTPSTSTSVKPPVSQNPTSVDSESPDKPKPASKGWGNIKTSVAVPNLNTIFDEKKVNADGEIELVEGNEFNEVTQNAFLSKWNEFAEVLRKESKITLYTIMTANMPVLEGVKVKVEVENGVQMEELKLGKIDMLNYLRVQLRNFALDIEGVMVEKSKERKPYTSQEKYQAMVAKNPLLDELRKTFDLGLS